ncbi:MAG: hypothetical protein ABSD49_07215 [Candidatus Bathyarchaeia archaeon]
METKDVTNSIFELDKCIRYVTILNHQYALLDSRMREGTPSLTPPQADRDFMTIAAPIMVGAAEKLKPFCGTIRRVTVRYDRVLLVFYRTAAHLVILSLEPKVEQVLLDRIGDSVRKLELVGSDEESKEG